MSDETKLLTGLKAAEVSLVKRGANKKKRFPIVKQEETMLNEEILKAILETEIDEEAEVQEQLEKAGVSEKAMGAIKSALRILSAYKDELPKNALDMLASAAGYPKPKMKMPEEEDKYPTPKKADAKKAEEEDKMKKEELPEDVQAILKEQDDRLKELQEKNAEVVKALEAERSRRELEEWTAKAKSELSHFPGKSADELGLMLKSLNDSDPELAKSQFESMKAASDALKESSLLTESGTVAKGDEQNGAWNKIVKKAEGLVKKSEDSEYSLAKAISDVLKNDTELYSQYLRENPRQTAPSV